MSRVVTGRADYQIRRYKPGAERDQARIGQEVAREWAWPYAYSLEDLLRIHARADFDPDTRHYAFLGDKMVGYAFSLVAPAEGGEPASATLDFPRVIPGHEAAARLLLDRALEALRAKGVTRVVGRVSTMAPRDIKLAAEAGFTLRDWGYKVYYSYEMAWGGLSVPGEPAEELHTGADLDASAELAAHWFGRPPAWCRTHLAEWHAAGIIAHVGVREQGRLVAMCLAASNDVRPTTAGIYAVYAPEARYLEPMLATVVARCIEAGNRNVIADLVNEHRAFEPVYRRLGFQKLAEWARCEMVLD